MTIQSRKTAAIIVTALVVGGGLIALSSYIKTAGLKRDAEIKKMAEGVSLENDPNALDLEAEREKGDLTAEEQLIIEQSRVEQAQKEWEKLNTTDRFSRDLFAKYLMLKQNGYEMSEEIQNALIDDVIKENTKPIAYTTYTEKDLRISQTETVDSLRAYGDALGKILFDNSPKNTESELLLLARLVEDGPNKEDIDKLTLISESYGQIVNRYVSLPVPPSMKVLHLATVNVMSALKTNIAAFADIETDSILATINITPYNKHFEILTQIIEQYRLLFEKKGVVFSTDGPGYAFTHLLQ